jgi:hypothetical protein
MIKNDESGDGEDGESETRESRGCSLLATSHCAAPLLSLWYALFLIYATPWSHTAPKLILAASSSCALTRLCLRTICRRSRRRTRASRTASPSSLMQRPSGRRRRQSPHSSTTVRPGELILSNPLTLDMHITAMSKSFHRIEIG